MSKIIVVNNLSLDGVMQAPGRPDEDRRGGFEHGGWAVPYNDAVMNNVMGARMAKGGSLLFGRRTYEDFARVWPSLKGNPFAEALNNMQKYVASNTLKGRLPWVNSTLLKGDAVDAVARLKKRSDKDLTILGSGMLIASLMKRNLIDEYVLMIHPLILGSGRRMFTDSGKLSSLKLVDSTRTTTGVTIETYQLADEAAAKASKPAAEQTAVGVPARAVRKQPVRQSRTAVGMRAGRAVIAEKLNGNAARSATTGHFVKMATATRHPSKTVVEKAVKTK